MIKIIIVKKIRNKIINNVVVVVAAAVVVASCAVECVLGVVPTCDEVAAAVLGNQLE